jgi:hypothetical protein
MTLQDGGAIMSLNGLNLSPKVFTPKKPLPNPNQQNFRLNYLSEFMSQQLLQNETINESIDEVLTTVNQTHTTHELKIDQIIEESHQQKEMNHLFLEKVDLQGKSTEEIFLSLQHLNEKNQQLSESIVNEQLMNQAILDQLTFQDQQLRNTNSQLENYVNLAHELSAQLLLQEQILKEMNQKLQVHDIYHNTVMESLDKQEAMNEKIFRQLDFLKSLIYERVNIMIEKVENSYQSTTEYFDGLFNKLGFMRPFLLSNRPKDKIDIEIEEENENKIN